MSEHTKRHRRVAGLAAAVSAIALLAACETGPTPEEIHQMDWSQAARIDTPPAYAEYMRVHPGGEYVVNAQRRTDELIAIEAAAYDTARKADTEDSYVAYLARFPWGRNAEVADARRAVLAAPRLAAEEKADWAEVRAMEQIDRYEAFLDEWPRGANAVNARARLDVLWKTDQGAFVKAKRTGSPVELEEFLRAYPRSEWADDARLEIDLCPCRVEYLARPSGGQDEEFERPCCHRL